MEVRHHVVSVLHLRVDRCHGQDQTSEATHGEHEDEAHSEQHGGFKRHGTLPHGGDPVEHLHASGHRDQHRGVHEEQLSCHRHARGVHVVRPDDERQNCDRRCGVHHRGVAKQFLARKCRHDVADDAEGWQDHDVHLWMSEEPEDVLIHHWVTTTSGVEEGCTEVTVSQRHGDGTSQHRHHSNQQISRDQPSPNEHRHLHECHARGTHIEDRHDDVDRTHDR